ncbi:MAG: DUF1622 domain-containing protein [Gemmatimonadales bacterium]
MLGLIGAALDRLATAVDLITGLVVAFAVAEAVTHGLRLSLPSKRWAHGGRDEIRLRLGSWLALALEFALASDIIRTALAPSWDDIGKLAAIVALRTVLNYFLGRELVAGARLVPEVRREAA